MSTDMLLSAQRVMIIVAHPDDAEMQCGGTIARRVGQGAVVSCVLATSGNRGTSDPAMTSDQLAALREAEQLTAAARLGVTDITFLRFDDGDLAYNAQPLRGQLTKLSLRLLSSALEGLSFTPTRSPLPFPLTRLPDFTW